LFLKPWNINMDGLAIPDPPALAASGCPPAKLHASKFCCQLTPSFKNQSWPSSAYAVEVVLGELTCLDRVSTAPTTGEKACCPNPPIGCVTAGMEVHAFAADRASLIDMGGALVTS